MAKKLQERIKENSEYIKSIEMTGGLNIVRVVYKDKWGTYASNDETIKVAASDEKPNEYFYYADADIVDVDAIIDLIEETVDMNKSTLIKIQLLKEKIEEMKELFSITPLNKLMTLKFTMDENVKEKKKRKYTKKKKVEEDAIPVDAEEQSANELEVIDGVD